MTTNNGASYTYDAEGHLTETAGATCAYDGDGNRVKKMIGSTGTIYWRGLDGEVANETDAANAILHRHVSFAGRRVSDSAVTWSFVKPFGEPYGRLQIRKIQAFRRSLSRVTLRSWD